MSVESTLAGCRVQRADGRVPRVVAADVPRLGARVVRVDVVGGAASGVLVTGVRPEHLAGLGVAHRRDDAAVARGVLVHPIHLEAGTVGDEVADVQRVAVLETRVVERRAVVVDGQRAEHDLVESVAVDVGGHELVVALALVLLAGHVRVERPALDELAVDEVPRDDHGARVVAATHDERGVLAVEVRDAREEPVDPVAVGITPRTDRPPARLVVDRVDRRAGLPVEDGEVLGPAQDVAARVAVVGARVADHGADAVDRAVGRLERHLRAPVAVEVEHLELRVVRAGADVHAEVDAPQARAVELHRFGVDLAGVARLRVVLRDRRVPEEHQLVLAVAVEVAHRAVARPVGDGLAVGQHVVGRLVQRDVVELVRPHAELVGDA